MPIRVLIADDHAILREGLGALLRKDPGFQVVGEARDGQEALDLLRQLQPDVAVLDITMPKLNGIEVCRTITAEQPNLRVVALSLHEDSHVLMGILKAGAQGYVLKNSAFQELATAIHAVATGQKYVSPALSSQLIGEALKPPTPSAATALNERDQKIVKWLSEGWTSKQIASQLGVSIKTVDTQRRQIMERLKIDSIAELTKFAVREGLTTLNGTPPQQPPQA